MAELFPQPGSQKHRAAQQQQADDHRPSGVIHIHAEIIGYRRNRQSNRQKSQLHQQLGRRQRQQRLRPPLGAAQLPKAGYDIQPRKNQRCNAQISHPRQCPDTLAPLA